MKGLSFNLPGRYPVEPTSAAYFPIAAARPSGSSTLTHSREWSRSPMTLGILSTNAIHNLSFLRTSSVASCWPPAQQVLLAENDDVVEAVKLDLAVASRPHKR